MTHVFPSRDTSTVFKIRIVSALVLSAFSSICVADVWTLIAQDGRKIDVDYIHYDGVELSIQRVGDYRQLKLSPDTLDPKCWKDLNQEMGATASIRMEVERRTKTDRETDRRSYSGYYYGYSRKVEEVQKLTQFTVELSSSTYFESELSIIYYILSSDGLDVGKVTTKISMPQPFEGTFSKMLEKTERSSSDTYWGTYYRSTSGDTKADFVVMVYNQEGDLVADYASSAKSKEYIRSVESQVARKLKLGSKKNLEMRSVDL